MGNSGDANRMVAAYQWMKYISNTENSAVWSTESGYGFVRTSSADHPLIAEKRAELPQYDKSLTMVQYGKGEPSVLVIIQLEVRLKKLMQQSLMVMISFQH